MIAKTKSLKIMSWPPGKSKKLILLVCLCLPSLTQAACVTGDCEDGFGTYSNPLYRYEGEFKGWLRDGHGTYMQKLKRNRYVGEWEQNLPHGQGSGLFMTACWSVCPASRSEFPARDWMSATFYWDLREIRCAEKGNAPRKAMLERYLVIGRKTWLIRLIPITRRCFL